MSVIKKRNSNDFKLLKSSAQIKLNQGKVSNTLRSENNFSLYNKKIDKLDNTNSKKNQESNLLILNYLNNASEKNSSEKTGLTDSSPENFDYDLTMLNKYEEDFNTSLDFISDFDLEKDDDKSFSSFESENDENDDDSFEKIEIKTKYNKKFESHQTNDDEVNDKLNKDFIDIKNLLLNHDV